MGRPGGAGQGHGSRGAERDHPELPWAVPEVDGCHVSCVIGRWKGFTPFAQACVTSTRPPSRVGNSPQPIAAREGLAGDPRRTLLEQGDGFDGTALLGRWQAHWQAWVRRDPGGGPAACRLLPDPPTPHRLPARGRRLNGTNGGFARSQSAADREWEPPRREAR